MADIEALAGALIAALRREGLDADRYTTGPGVAGVNVWSADLSSGPAASVAISVHGKFRDYAWGHQWQHSLPLDTPVTEVAAAVARTIEEDS